ncbi:MAG: glycosyltransferase family 2 protein [Planctomycetota bacterium]
MNDFGKRAEASSGGPTYSVVVPVYNTSETLVELAARFDRLFREVVLDSYEIIFVDDCSPREESWQTITSLAEQASEVRGFQLMRNFGKAGAVLCGFQQARGRYVVTIDDDLQQAPEDLPALLQEKHHDVVMGAFRSRRDSLFARFSSRIKGWFDQRILGKPKHVRVSPYKLFKVEIVKAMLEIRTPYPFIPALMYYLTKDVVNVEVSHHPREYGRSGFTFSRKVRQFLALLINNSSFLLQAVAALGILMAVSSMLLGGVIVIRKLFYDINAPGWASTMVVQLVIGGMVLFSLGVIGEYLIRIINGVEQRPPFVVRSRVESARSGGADGES